LAGLIAGIFLAGKFYPTVAGWFGFIHNPDMADIIGFIIILAVVMLLAAILARIVHAIVSGIMLGWLDHLIGGILGLLIGAISLGVLLALWVKFFSADAVSGSALAKILLDKFPLVLALLPSSFDAVKDFFH